MRSPHRLAFVLTLASAIGQKIYGSVKMYFAHSSGEQLGPFPPATIKKMLKDGTLSTDCQVWTEGMDSWQPVSQVALRPELPRARALKVLLSAGLCVLLIGGGIYYGKQASGPSKAERVRMDLEVAEAEQEVAEAKRALDTELATPKELIAQLAPEDIEKKMALLRQAKTNFIRKSNHLKLLKEAQAKLNQ